MEIAFYVSALVAVVSTFLVITQTNAVHALLYLVVSLLSVSIVLFTLGAPFVAALEVIVYAGAIMVLFVFVVMMLNLGQASIDQERAWLSPGTWIGPSILCAILVLEMAYALLSSPGALASPLADSITPKQVGMALFGPYILGVELASMLLLAGLVGAYHLGRREHGVPDQPGEVPQMLGGDGHGREQATGTTKDQVVAGTRIPEPAGKRR